mgnify:CR=1 FL=1|jgi:hypothetical protein
MEILRICLANNKDKSGTAFAQVRDKHRPRLRGIIVEGESQRHSEKMLRNYLSELFSGDKK